MFLQLNPLPVKLKNPGRVDLLATTTKYTFFWSPVHSRSTALIVLSVQFWFTCCVALLHLGPGQSFPFSSLSFVIRNTLNATRLTLEALEAGKIFLARRRE